MKHSTLLLGAALCLPLHAGLQSLGVHLDVRSEYVDGAWENKLRVDGPPGFWEPSLVFLPLSDRATSLSGARATQPSSSLFTFTGASPGDPLWRAAQGSPGIGDVWPGFDNDQSGGTFGEYIPADSRVSQSTARAWIKVSLVNYTPPPGKSSHFSMWNSSSGNPPTIWMSTAEPPADNAYYYTEGGHTHVWWGFTALGVHKLTLSSSAYLGPGQTNPTGAGDPFTLIFTTGTVAAWQATWFNADELDDLAISGLDADPDKDGIVNLIEYAFGTNPRLGGAVPTSEGLGLPTFSLLEEEGIFYQTLTYPRRREGDRLFPEVYEAQFSTNLAGDWSDANVETIASDFAPPLDGLNDEWELVVSRRPVPEGSDRGFGRVSVTAGDDN